MAKGKLLSKLNIFKKKKRISRETLRPNSMAECQSNNMETIPEIVRGNTLPVMSRDYDYNVYSNKRKNISSSSVEEDIDKKKKQPYLGPEQASSSDCPIPTPASSTTSSCICNNNLTSVIENNTKEKHESSSPVSMNCEEKELKDIASSSNSSNNQRDEKMKVEVKQLPENKESNDITTTKTNISFNSNENENKNMASTTLTTSNNKNNKNSDTPPHTPTIFITSKSTVSSIDVFDDNNNNANHLSNDAPINEIKSRVNEFDLYVEDIINKLALDTNLTTEVETEEDSNRYNRATSTEPDNPNDYLTTESLTPTQNNLNLSNIQNQQVLSNLNTVQTNDITQTTTEFNNNTVNVLNNNTKKEAFNGDIIKKNNEDKKDKKVDEDYNPREKENKTNSNKAKNADIEKYIEKETSHPISESIDVLNNTIEMLKCGICLDILLDPKIVEPCGHSFCNHCLRLLQTRVCPLCRTRIHDYHSSVLLNELSELIAKFSLNSEQLEERNQCLQDIEEKDKHLNDECMRLIELMELAHQPENSNSYSVQFNELIELNETDDDI
ncbi:hypothetical protein BCR36DRAFT_338574 [Piromyces finnis]|uniref:RING-type E3 ubiquitin transferase n=1 Tax=Piromyces finnis TaxID=1754191 RepID=A0A1Y1UWA7_9FUNG|nr:hypothetical protein BCR36DRAFT_338574 [Piromyces finnis]|eukprot:ORX41893.1 hypothetical protein BCR36DRAFT_338574 [Piromyces finnis]